MSHQLFRLLESVYNTPHLVTQAALEPIVSYLEQRNQNISFSVVNAAQEEVEQEMTQLGPIGNINIDGTLTYKPVYGLCGPTGTSYTGILEQAEELIAGGITTLVTTHSSPGGQAAHCFSTVQALREMCDEAGVKWVSYIDTLSASASLAFSVAADEVIIHPSASTGSIGCVVCLMDQSKAMANAGLKPVFISSTPGKTPFNADGAFSDEFLAGIQEDVTRLGDEFAAHVSMHTGIDVDTIKSMDAKVFHAQAALEQGLVTAIMDHKQFDKYIVETLEANNA